MNEVETPPVITRYVRFSLSRWDVLRCRLWVTAHNWKLVGIILLMCAVLPVLNFKTPEGMHQCAS